MNTITRAPWRRPTLARLNGDVAGGFSATLIAIPQAMSLGILMFGALGPTYASVGLAAALLSSVIGNLVIAGSFAMRCHIVGARASTTTLVAALVAALAAHPSLQLADGPDAPRVIALVVVAAGLSGVIQMLLGLAGFGRMIKFVPYQVVSGFMNGVAILIIVSQVRPILGLEGYESLVTTLGDLAHAKPGSVAVAATALAATVFAQRNWRRVPPMIFGLAAGIAAHYAIAYAIPGSAGPVVGPMPDTVASLHSVGEMVNLVTVVQPEVVLGWVVPAAILIAVVAAFDGLLAAVVADSVTGGRHNSNRLVLSQGVATVASSLFGAIPVVSNAHTPVANHLAGGRTPFSTLFHALFMLATIYALGPVVGGIPVAALSGLMVYIAVNMIDRWSGDLVRRLVERGEGRAETAVNVAIVAVVATAQVAFNVMAALAVGIFAAVALLLVKLSGSPVRRSFDGTMRTSHKVRSPEARTALALMANEIRVLELEGEIFFGTADRLLAEVEAIGGNVRFLILDFRRVHQIEASGARVLEQIGRRASRRGLTILLSDVRASERRGRYLTSAGVAAAIPQEQWFADLDRALEWTEDQLLERARFLDDAGELPLERMALFRGFSAEEIEQVAAALDRHELRSGDPVFLEGEEGDRLYVIARGAVSIKLKLHGEERARRLATFTSGVMFGEMALLEGLRRSADAFAKGDPVILYSLDASRFGDLVVQHPNLGLKIFRNLSGELASRLRTTSGALRALE